jgi:flavin-dependent thymidylate synthase
LGDEKGPSGALVRWADEAMYEAEEMPFDVNATGPRVTLLNATPQPLGAIAAMAKMYKGEVVRDLSDVTREERVSFFEDINNTKLKAPFEAVTLHFLVEGVTRSFTHQMVRQRTAVFAQESLRFAVKENIDEEVALPPSMIGLKKDDPRVVIWRSAVNKVDDAYHALVDNGVPAEDARGLLPHNITTRLHYVTNLRALQDHGGNRLCTQAQFEWRVVWDQIIRAISNYESRLEGYFDDWEFKKIASIFRPVCYLTGKCEFKASFDRPCKIRDRVQANAAIGRPSSEWHTEKDLGMPDFSREPSLWANTRTGHEIIPAIDPGEWMLDPTAAR